MTVQGKYRDRTEENVKNFWEGTTITSRDYYARKLEDEVILEYLSPNDSVLDIGCGNGEETLIFAKKVANVVGIDYMQGMINKAEDDKINQPVEIANKVAFEVGSVLDIPCEDNEFDVVIGERLLINLTTWELQQKAINEIARVLKRGGLYICLEVTEEGHNEVNHFRSIFGLDILERYWHNNYIVERIFTDYIKGNFELQEVKRFGMYHFLSKVVYPLFVRPEEPKFLDKFNEIAKEIASKIPNFKDCSHQALFVLRKR